MNKSKIFILTFVILSFVLIKSINAQSFPEPGTSDRFAGAKVQYNYFYSDPNGWWDNLINSLNPSVFQYNTDGAWWEVGSEFKYDLLKGRTQILSQLANRDGIYFMVTFGNARNLTVGLGPIFQDAVDDWLSSMPYPVDWFGIESEWTGVSAEENVTAELENISQIVQNYGSRLFILKAVSVPWLTSQLQQTYPIWTGTNCPHWNGCSGFFEIEYLDDYQYGFGIKTGVYFQDLNDYWNDSSVVDMFNNADMTNNIGVLAPNINQEMLANIEFINAWNREAQARGYIRYGTTPTPPEQISISGQLSNNTDPIQADVIVYNQETDEINNSDSTNATGNYNLTFWPDTYDLQFNILYIPNLFIKLISLDILSDLVDVINNVNKLDNGVNFTLNISTDQEIQVYSDEEPLSVKANGVELTKGTLPLSSGEWTYIPAEQKIRIIASPFLPTCTCDDWIDQGCGLGGCASDEQYQTRSCSPARCNAESQCVYDISCVNTCSDGTPYDQCSSTKPLYCDNGNLVDKCTQCGCDTGQSCNTTTEECYTSSPPTETILYGGGMGNPGAIVKVDLGTFEVADSITLNSGENGHTVTVDSDYLYVGTGTVPTKLMKFRLSDLSRVDEETLSNEFQWTMNLHVFDDDYLYAVYWFNPGRLARFDKSTLTMLASTSTALPRTRDVVKSGSYIYVSSLDDDKDQTIIQKLNAVTLGEVDRLTLSNFDGSNMMVSGDELYIAHGYPNGVTKIDLNTFTEVDHLDLDSLGYTDMVIEYDGVLYLNGDTTPAIIYRVQKDFSSWDKLTLSIGRIALLQTSGQYMYSGNMDNPSKLVKVDLNTFTEVGYITTGIGSMPQIVI